MQGGGIVLVALGRFDELVGDLNLRGTQDDPGLALPLRLGALGHGVLQLFGDHDVGELDRKDGDPPGIGLAVQDLLDLAADPLPFGQKIGKIVAADGIPQGGLGGQNDRFEKVLHLEDRLGSVPDHPEGQGIHVNRHGVHGNGLFSTEVGGPDSGIHETGYLVDEGKNQKDSGAPQPVVFPEPQDHRLLPMVGHLNDWGEEVPQADHQGEGEHGPCITGEHADPQAYAEDQNHSPGGKQHHQDTAEDHLRGDVDQLDRRGAQTGSELPDDPRPQKECQDQQGQRTQSKIFWHGCPGKVANPIKGFDSIHGFTHSPLFNSLR